MEALAERGARVVVADVDAARALDEGRFLALPHPRVAESFRRKADDYDAWLERTSRRLRRMRGEVA